MIAYSMENATIAHVAIFAIFVVFVLITRLFRRDREPSNIFPVMKFLLNFLISFLAGICASVSVGVFSSVILKRHLSYYASPILTIPLFGIPCFTGNVNIVTNKYKLLFKQLYLYKIYL